MKNTLETNEKKHNLFNEINMRKNMEKVKK
jgi:hypothetical protein